MEIKSIRKPGTVTVTPEGEVIVEGFEVDFADTAYAKNLSGCQEVFHAGAAWALQQIAYAMSPEGQHKSGVN